jgi:hypothetical protein
MAVNDLDYLEGTARAQHWANPAVEMSCAWLRCAALVLSNTR